MQSDTVQKSLLSISGIAILGLVLLFLNSIAGSAFSRFFVDLTEEGLYSLSPGTESILEKLESPVTLRYYFSRTDSAKYPGAKLYADRIEDLLKQYERLGRGNIVLEMNDPRPDTEEEEWALKYGLTPMTLPTGENLFFGLAGVNSSGGEESIPLFNLMRQEFLEYDITKLVYSLSNSKKKVVGIISPLKLQGEAAAANPMGAPSGGAEKWVFASQLEAVAEVRYLGVDVASIDKSIDALMVIHPKNLPEQTRYAIDQYAVGGGKLFIAIDPYCASDTADADPNNPMGAMFADRSSNLSDLLSTWGVNAKSKFMTADINLATPVSSGRSQTPENFVAWLSINSAHSAAEPIINTTEVATSSLENVLLPWAGSLELIPVEGVTSVALLKTTSDAMELAEQEFKFAAQNPAQLLRDYRSGQKQLVLAAKINGKLKSSFKNKPGAGAEATMSSVGGHLPIGTEPATVMVIADVDFLADQYSAAVQNFMGTKIVSLLNDNLNFAVNSVENLTGSDDLISLRSRGQFVRPFTRVKEIEAEAQSKWQREEATLQAKLNEANRRLSEVQSAVGSEKGKAVFTDALLDEVKKFREERSDAQRKLREVRRNLRQDKERLGNVLFALNTFLIPLVLIGYAVLRGLRRKSPSGKIVSSPVS